MSNYAIPYYRNTTDDSYNKLLTIEEIIDVLNNPQHQSIKKENLPVLMWSAKIEGKYSPKKPISHTALIVFDIDDISPKQISRIKSLPYFRFTFTSPSGQGLKIIVPINPLFLPRDRVDHKKAFEVARNYVEHHAKIKVDRSQHDAARKCYLGYDPEPTYNPDSPIISWHEKKIYNQEFARLYREDFDEYNSWITQGAILKRKYGDIGKNIWIAWSMSSEHYNLQEINEKWETFEAYTPALIEPTEISVKETLSGPVLKEILETKGLSIRLNARTEDIEITSKDLAWITKISEPQATSNLRAIKGIDFQTNDGWLIVSDVITSILKENLRQMEVTIPFEREWWDCIYFAAAQNRVDTFTEWLESLEWDRTPRLDNLFTIIDAQNPEKYPMNSKLITKTLVGAIERTIFPGNVHDWMPVLVGEQGTGKSLFIKNLLPENRGWFSDSPDLKESMEKQLEKIGSAVLIEYPEISGSTRKDINRIKAWISKPSDQFRKPYARSAVTVARKWVAIATANDDGSGVLPPDPTGHRRFATVEVHGTKNPHKLISELQAINEQLWAEALEIWKTMPSGYNLLTQEEQEITEERNYPYTPKNEVLLNIVIDGHQNNLISNKELGDIAAELQLVAAKEELATNFSIRNDLIRALRSIGYRPEKDTGGKYVWTSRK